MAYRDTSIISEDATQRKVDASQSNPNTPLTAQTTQVATQPQASLTTTDPVNGGTTPATQTSGTDTTSVTALNADLKSGLFSPTTGSPGSLENIYGISSAGYSPEEIQKLPESKVGEGGNIYTKVVNPYILDASTNPKYQELNKDINSINIDIKQANSGIGMDMNLSYSVSDTDNLAQQMASIFPNGNKELESTGDWGRFVSAYNNYNNTLNQIKAGASYDDVNNALSGVIADLKMSMIPIVNKAKSIEYAKFGADTTLGNTYGNFLNSMNKFQELYKADGKRLQDLVGNFQNSLQKYNIEYKSLTDQKSVLAKEKLKNNPAYQDFVNTIVKQQPLLKDKIDNAMKENTITQFENDLIKNYFIGGYASELFTARTAAIQQFGPTASSWFKDFDDIINVKDLLYETKEDDLLAGINYGQIDYSKYGGSFDYSLSSNSSNFLSNVNSSGQNTNTEYTIGKVGSVNKTING